MSGIDWKFNAEAGELELTVNEPGTFILSVREKVKLERVVPPLLPVNSIVRVRDQWKTDQGFKITIKELIAAGFIATLDGGNDEFMFDLEGRHINAADQQHIGRIMRRRRSMEERWD